MSKAVMLCSFNLIDGKALEDFWLISEKVGLEFMSKQKGFISWQQLVEAENLVDIVTWETMNDAQNAIKVSEQSEIAFEYFSFIDMNTLKVQFLSVAKEH